MKNSFVLFFLFISVSIAFSQNIWTQTDWSDNQYLSLEDINSNASPGELILKNETSNMILAFIPSQLEGIWNMEVYNEKLFVASCTDPFMINGGEIISFDYALNSFQWEYDVWEQGVVQMRSQNGKLYIPGVDSQGSWNLGNIYIYDGNSWLRKETVPHGVHVLDLIFYQDQMYITTGTDLGNDAGIVYKSNDEGDNWSNVFSIEAEGDDFRRFYSMGIFEDQLFIQGDLKEPEGKVCFSFDGNNWNTYPLDRLTSLSYGILETFENKFYYFNKASLYIFDGTDWEHINLPFSGGSIARGIGFYDGFIYGGSENGLLYKSNDGSLWQLEADLGNMNEEIESIETYHGRLYVGTNTIGGKGKVYVSSSLSTGNLVSLKHDYESPILSGNINWTSLIPNEATTIKFQIKTASTSNDLDNESFIGPGGTNESFYDTPGEELCSCHNEDQWIQYKVFFDTSDSSFSPVLQDITITTNLNSLNSYDLETNEYFLSQNYPNPFNSSTEIKFSLAKSCFASLKLFNLEGVLIKTLVSENLPSGEHHISLNRSELSNNIYFYRLETEEFVATKKLLLLK